ncbi:MAG TPA: hypothetical protein VFC44_11920 [Candidatus Saccharimonadales bacterium]|nr:hypothetical protein [Candidatus Saccharimonadales bacterium]
MKTKFQVAKVALAAVVGSLLWAGCASTAPADMNGRPVVDNTINLQDTGPDTHPEWRTGIYNYNYQGNWDVTAIE